MSNQGVVYEKVEMNYNKIYLNKWMIYWNINLKVDLKVN